MTRNSERNWTKWGEIDPYFGVLTHEKFRKGNLDTEALEEFFLSGQEHVDAVMSLATRMCPEIQLNKMLDFGCGVGRLLFPFAKLFKRAIGVDISEGMLHELEVNAVNFSVSNVELYRDLGSFSKDEYFDLVHSYIVLQHIETDYGIKLIERLSGMAKPENGVIALHVTYWRNASFIREFVHYSRARIGLINGLMNAINGRALNNPLMQMNNYSLNVIFERLHERGFVEFSAYPTNHSGHLGLMILGRRQIT